MIQKSYLIIGLLLLSLSLAADDVKELQKQQRKLQQEMENTNKMLQQTKRNETATMNKLELIGQNIKTQNRLINNLDREIGQLNNEMNQLAARRDTLQSNLEKLKDNYARMIRESHFARLQQSPLLFILSSENFEQMSRRLRYLQEIATYRKEQVARIVNTQQEIDHQNELLEEHKQDKQSALKQQQRQKENLNRDKKKQQKMLTELKKKNKDLSAQLKTQQKKADELNKKIDKLIREQAQKQGKTPLTKEQQLLSGGFKQNKGRLPWPIERGNISGHFGKHQHPVYDQVTIDNKGIYLQTTSGSKARAVYEGQISGVFVMNNTYVVIVQHGDYRSVYSGLSTIQVKQGDKVKAKQYLGTIYCDTEQDNKTELYFQIYEGKEIRNPELWLAQ